MSDVYKTFLSPPANQQVFHEPKDTTLTSITKDKDFEMTTASKNDRTFIGFEKVSRAPKVVLNFEDADPQTITTFHNSEYLEVLTELLSKRSSLIMYSEDISHTPKINFISGIKRKDLDKNETKPELTAMVTALDYYGTNVKMKEVVGGYSQVEYPFTEPGDDPFCILLFRDIIEAVQYKHVVLKRAHREITPRAFFYNEGKWYLHGFRRNIRISKGEIKPGGRFIGSNTGTVILLKKAEILNSQFPGYDYSGKKKNDFSTKNIFAKGNISNGYVLADRYATAVSLLAMVGINKNREFYTVGTDSDIIAVTNDTTKSFEDDKARQIIARSIKYLMKYVQMMIRYFEPRDGVTPTETLDDADRLWSAITFMTYTSTTNPKMKNGRAVLSRITNSVERWNSVGAYPVLGDKNPNSIFDDKFSY